MNNTAFSHNEIRLAFSKDENLRIRSAMGDAFMQHVDNSNIHRYKLSTVLAELHLGGKINNFPHQFAGILYPSLRVKGDGDNLALLPEFVDKNLELRKAIHIRIEKKEDAQINITYLDHASSVSSDGSLIWLGRLPQWEGSSPAHAICTSGVDFQGDYFISTDGLKSHWVVKDNATNNIIVPV
jgi:hypothetical protein